MRREIVILGSTFVLSACGSSSTTPAGVSGAPLDSGTTAVAPGAPSQGDGGVEGDDAGDAPPTNQPDGGTSAADAGPGVDLDGGTTVVVIQPVSGTPVPTTGALHGPGVILMGGGTDVDAAFVWMHDTLAGSASLRMGNVVVLRADSNSDNAYTPYIYALAPFQSVASIYLGGSPSNGAPATPTDLAIAAYYVDRADAVFFAGGDQADYVSWKGSPLMKSVAALYARGGVVGGTSAGCAVQGPFVFDSVAADANGNANVATADAVANPFEKTISFTTGLFAFPSLPNVIADMHFVTRDRLGRLAAFVARQYADGVATGGVVGVGVDESNALLVDGEGKATLAQQSGGTEASAGTGAYVLQPAGAADTCTSGKPLLYKGVKVTRLSSTAGDSFDFKKGCGTGMQLTLTIDGASASHPYSQSPYTTAGTATKCP